MEFDWATMSHLAKDIVMSLYFDVTKKRWFWSPVEKASEENVEIKSDPFFSLVVLTFVLSLR